MLQCPKLLRENGEMRYQIEVLETQVSAVNWLTRVVKMHNRLDAENII